VARSRAFLAFTFTAGEQQADADDDDDVCGGGDETLLARIAVNEP